MSDMPAVTMPAFIGLKIKAAFPLHRCAGGFSRFFMPVFDLPFTGGFKINPFEYPVKVYLFAVHGQFHNTFSFH
jgi:hypothetical protein